VFQSFILIIILLFYQYLLLHMFSSAFIPFMDRNSIYYDFSDQMHLFSCVLPLMTNIQIHIDAYIYMSIAIQNSNKVGFSFS